MKGRQPDAPRSNTIIAVAIVDAYLQLAKGKPDRAFDRLDERIDGYRQAGFLYSLAEELWLRGRARLLLGQLEAARVALLESRKVAEAGEERVTLWQVMATLSELERASGHLAAAEKRRGEARKLIDEIAAHAGELRSAFLGQPSVGQLD